MSKATITRENSNIKIMIDGLLHLIVQGSSIVAVHSYKMNDTQYYIEYHIENQVVKTEYESKQLWESILRQLDKIIS